MKDLNNFHLKNIFMADWLTLGFGVFFAGLGFYGLSNWSESYEKIFAIILIALGVYLVSKYEG